MPANQPSRSTLWRHKKAQKPVRKDCRTQAFFETQTKELTSTITEGNNNVVAQLKTEMAASSASTVMQLTEVIQKSQMPQKGSAKDEQPAMEDDKAQCEEVVAEQLALENDKSQREEQSEDKPEEVIAEPLVLEDDKSQHEEQSEDKPEEVIAEPLVLEDDKSQHEEQSEDKPEEVVVEQLEESAKEDEDEQSLELMKEELLKEKQMSLELFHKARDAYKAEQQSEVAKNSQLGELELPDLSAVEQHRMKQRKFWDYVTATEDARRTRGYVDFILRTHGVL